MKKTLVVVVLALILLGTAWGQQGTGLAGGPGAVSETTATVPRFYILNPNHAPIATCDYDWKNCSLVGNGKLDDVVAVFHEQINMKDAEIADLREKYIHEMKAHLATLKRFQQYVGKVNKIAKDIDGRVQPMNCSPASPYWNPLSKMCQNVPYCPLSECFLVPAVQP